MQFIPTFSFPARRVGSVFSYARTGLLLKGITWSLPPGPPPLGEVLLPFPAAGEAVFPSVPDVFSTPLPLVSLYGTFFGFEIGFPLQLPSSAFHGSYVLTRAACVEYEKVFSGDIGILPALFLPSCTSAFT